MIKKIWFWLLFSFAVTSIAHAGSRLPLHVFSKSDYQRFGQLLTTMQNGTVDLAPTASGDGIACTITPAAEARLYQWQAPIMLEILPPWANQSIDLIAEKITTLIKDEMIKRRAVARWNITVAPEDREGEGEGVVLRVSVKDKSPRRRSHY
jgi:hypothetical protein